MDQIHLLVARLKSEEGVNFNKDWKVITILIGGNDLCQSCKDKVSLKLLNIGREEGRKEGNVLFNDALNTIYMAIVWRRA